MCDCEENGHARRDHDGRHGPGPLLLLAAIALIAMARHRRQAFDRRFAEGFGGGKFGQGPFGQGPFGQSPFGHRHGGRGEATEA